MDINDSFRINYINAIKEENVALVKQMTSNNKQLILDIMKNKIDVKIYNLEILDFLFDHGFKFNIDYIITDARYYVNNNFGIFVDNCCSYSVSSDVYKTICHLTIEYKNYSMFHWLYRNKSCCIDERDGYYNHMHDHWDTEDCHCRCYMDECVIKSCCVKIINYWCNTIIFGQQYEFLIDCFRFSIENNKKNIVNWITSELLFSHYNNFLTDTTHAWNDLTKHEIVIFIFNKVIDNIEEQFYTSKYVIEQNELNNINKQICLSLLIENNINEYIIYNKKHEMNHMNMLFRTSKEIFEQSLIKKMIDLVLDSKKIGIILLKIILQRELLKKSEFNQYLITLIYMSCNLDNSIYNVKINYCDICDNKIDSTLNNLINIVFPNYIIFMKWLCIIYQKLIFCEKTKKLYIKN